jgi:hypothetical protein
MEIRYQKSAANSWIER